MSKDVNYMIEVMKAYTEGKEIESRHGVSKDWNICPEPSWDWVVSDYRVKEEPRYRPYESTDEMIEDFCKRSGVKCVSSMMPPVIWIKDTICNAKKLVLGLGGDYVFTHFGNDVDSWSLSELFDRFTYSDGSPVGKVE